MADMNTCLTEENKSARARTILQEQFQNQELDSYRTPKSLHKKSLRS